MIYDDATLKRLMEKPEGPGPYDPLPGKLAQMLLMQRDVTRALELQFEEARKIIEQVSHSPEFKKFYCGNVEQDPLGVHAFTAKYAEKRNCETPKRVDGCPMCTGAVIAGVPCPEHGFRG